MQVKAGSWRGQIAKGILHPSSEFGSGRAGAARHLLDLGGQESLHSLLALLAGDFPRTWGTKPNQQGQSVTSRSDPSGC